jgi:hypothetical protein
LNFFQIPYLLYFHPVKENRYSTECLDAQNPETDTYFGLEASVDTDKRIGGTYQTLG